MPTVYCIKLKQDAEAMPRPPMPGALGLRVFQNVSQAAWKDWQEHQTRLINEYRLILADAKARAFLTKECENYFFGSGELTQTGYVPVDVKKSIDAE